MKYLKTTFKSFEDLFRKELDSIQQVVQTPDEAVYYDCKYPIEKQTDNFLSGIGEYSSYTWDDDTKTAKITLNDDQSLIVKRGGCDQFDFYITLNLKNKLIDLNNKDIAIKQLLIHAEKLFEPEDYSILLTALQQGNYKLDKYDNELRMVFNIETYCFAEIYISIHKSQNKSSLKIGYSKC